MLSPVLYPAILNSQSCNHGSDLAGKVAIVTGSSRGLGLATATALVREGCQ